jgi:hypothetical protein
MPTETKLMTAIKNKNVDEFFSLINMEMDINYANDYGRTFLHEAVIWGEDRVVKALLEKHPDVNTCDLEQYSPLHSAAEKGLCGVVDCLLQAGADVDAVVTYTVEGIQTYTARDFAELEGRSDVLHLIDDFKGRKIAENTAICLTPVRKKSQSLQFFTPTSVRDFPNTPEATGRSNFFATLSVLGFEPDTLDRISTNEQRQLQSDFILYSEKLNLFQVLDNADTFSEIRESDAWRWCEELVNPIAIAHMLHVCTLFKACSYVDALLQPISAWISVIKDRYDFFGEKLFLKLFIIQRDVARLEKNESLESEIDVAIEECQKVIDGLSSIPRSLSGLFSDCLIESPIKRSSSKRALEEDCLEKISLKRRSPNQLG